MRKHHLFQKTGFLLINYIYCIKKNYILTKVITFSESISKIIVILHLTLDLFKLSSWKRVCKISFELQMSRTSWTSSWKALKVDTPHKFYGPFKFSTIFTFKVLGLSLYECALPCDRHL